MENQQLEFIHGKTLISFKNYSPVLKLTDVVFPNEEIELISSNPEPFKALFVDTLLTLDETQFLIGFANGFVQRISLPNTIILKTYNPLLFQKEEPLVEKKEEKQLLEKKEEKQQIEKKKEASVSIEEKKEEQQENEPSKEENENPSEKQIIQEDVPKKNKTIILDNFLMPGIESLGSCNLYELLFVNHRNYDKNAYNRTFALEETPIFIYKFNGEKHMRLRNCSGTVLQNSILDNRGLYLVLTSGNLIYAWNFLSNSLILKISLDNLGMKGGSETFFTTMSARSFDINQRLVTADKIYDFSYLKNLIKMDYKTIDGDLIFTAERNGGFLISKLTFENEKNEVSWIPMKIFDMKEKDTQQNKSKVLNSIKSIQNNISVLFYDKFQDNLYMIDHKSSVRIFKRITQKIFAP